MNTVWITGAGGLIGHHLACVAPQALPGVKVCPLTRGQLDLLEEHAVRSRFAAERPDAVIHCAALSRSQDCERDPGLAHRLNVETTALLAELFAGGRMVFLSTDLVFDGKQGHYREEDSVNPLIVYAETKVLAEQRVLRHPGHIVIRTSLNAGKSPTGDRGLDEQMLNAWRSGATLRLFTDEYRCPIPASVTARAACELLQSGAGGVYHVAGAERLSRWDLGCLLAGAARHLQPKYTPASLKEYQGAPRSPDTSLDCAKVQRLLSFPLPRFSDWLRANSLHAADA